MLHTGGGQNPLSSWIFGVFADPFSQFVHTDIVCVLYTRWYMSSTVMDCQIECCWFYHCVGAKLFKCVSHIDIITVNNNLEWCSHALDLIVQIDMVARMRKKHKLHVVVNLPTELYYKNSNYLLMV